MINNILAIGDSYTYGSELENPGRDSWPMQLAIKLNSYVTNLGMPSSSNDRIFRLAIEHTLELQYDLVICAWTEVSRLDLWANDREFQVTSASVDYHAKQYPWIKEYYARHYDDRHSTKTWLTRVLALQEYFKNKGQRYIFANMQPNNEYREHYTKLGLTKFIDQIDTDNYLGWPEGEGMHAWIGDAEIGSCGHPLELGHKRIAEKYYEHIRNIGWLS